MATKIDPQLVKSLIDNWDKPQIDLEDSYNRLIGDLVQKLKDEGLSAEEIAPLIANLLSRTRIRQAQRNLVYDLVKVEELPKAAALLYYHPREDDNDPSSK